MANPEMSSQDDDEISLTSTISEQYTSDQEFGVDRILAEKVLRGKKLFLILWEDYPEEKSTWEPENHINPGVLDLWGERKTFEQENPLQRFDVAGFEARLNQLAKEKARRHLLRKAKKKRLNMPVSASGSDAEMADDSDSSIEDVEDDDIGDARTTKVSSKRKSTPPEEQFPAGSPIDQTVKESLLRTSLTLGEDSISPSSLNSRTLDQAHKGPSSKVKPIDSRAGMNKSLERSASRTLQSSSDVSLAKRNELLQRPSSSSSDEPLEFLRPKSNTASAPLSVKAVPRGSASLRGTVKGVSAIRGGRAATRGAIHKNVFAMGSSSTAKTTRGNLLTNAADTTKKPKAFTSKRLERKVLVQGREKADAAPDISVVPGGLFDPSNVTSVDPIRPSNLRKTSVNDGSESLFVSEVDGQVGIAVDPLVMRVPAPNYQLPTFTKSTCYYWHNQQRNNNTPPCQKGAACEYLHAYREGAPIAPAPVDRFSDQPRESVCFFWNRSEQDKSQPGCIKGDACTYWHEYRPGVPVAPPPTGYAASSSASMPVSRPTFHDNSDILNHSGVFTHSPVSSPGKSSSIRMSTCYYWDKHQRGESAIPCTKGDDECLYFHEYRPGVPIAAPPPSRFKESRSLGSSSNLVPLGSKEPSEASPMNKSSQSLRHRESLSSEVTQASSLSSHPFPKPSPLSHVDQLTTQAAQGRASIQIPSEPQLQVVNRPRWDPERPHNAICYYWLNDYCRYSADSCKFYHSNDKRLPVAPGPDFETAHMLANETHSSIAETPNKEVLRDESNTSLKTGRPLWDPSKPYNSICHFYWTRGSCVRGTGCKYYHADSDSLPIAPAPGSQPQTCRDWLATGDCNFPNCRFLHPPPKPKSSPLKPSVIPYHNETVTRAPATSRGTKSVKFADEESLSTHQSFTRDLEFGSMDYDAMEIDIVDNQEQASLPHDTANQRQSTLDPRSATSSVDPVAHSAQQPLPDTGKVKRTKINMDDYRRKKLMAGLGLRGKEVVFGRSETKSFHLDFSDIETAKPSEWKDAWERTSKIIFSQMCMAQDFRAQQGFFQRRQLQEVPGNLVPGDPTDAAAVKALNAAADELILRSAGLVSIPSNNSSLGVGILVYPAKKEEWKFLDPSSEHPTNVRLRYFIFQCDSDVSQFFSNESNDLSMGQPYRMTMAERLHGLQLTTLLPPFQKGQNPYNFFLLFPETAKQSEDFITTWIKAIHPKSKIHSSRNDGAWKFFVNSPAFDMGVVLAHESAVVELAQLPSLFSVVNSSKKTVCFWFLSDSDTQHPMYPSRYSPDALEIGRIKPVRLFPRGCAFLLTPSFLVAEPQKAYDLFHWFLSTSRAKYATTTPRSWKLVCCRKLSDYLLKVAIAKVAEKENFEAENHNKPTKDATLKERGLSYENCELRFKLHALLAKFDNQNMLEPSSDPEEAVLDSDTSEDSERPFVYADRCIDPDDEPALIKWFAGWTVRKLDRFKKFVVIGTDAKSSSRATRKIEVVVKKPISESTSRPLSLSTKSAAARSIETARVASAMERAQFVAAKYKLPPASRQSERNVELIVGKNLEQENSDILHPETVEFIQITGGSIGDANKFLNRAGNNVSHAVQLYNNDEAVSELINTERELAQCVSSQNRGTVAHDAIHDFDGADERPTSSGSNASNTSRSGIVTGQNGERIVPRSLHLTDNSIRSEINTRPGDYLVEGMERYRPPNSREGSAPNSRRGSTAMEIDFVRSNTLAGSKRVLSIKGKGRHKDQPATEMKEIVFGATTEWYKKLVEERGYGWEHIYIAAWDKAFVQLGLTK